MEVFDCPAPYKVGGVLVGVSVAAGDALFAVNWADGLLDHSVVVAVGVVGVVLILWPFRSRITLRPTEVEAEFHAAVRP